MTNLVETNAGGSQTRRADWHYDPSGNWYAHGDASTTTHRTHDANNRLNKIGGAGRTMVEGTLDEPGAVGVNGQPATVTGIPGTGQFNFQREIAVQEGANTFEVTATDALGNQRVQNYSVQVGGTEKTFEYDANGNLRFEKDAAGAILRSFEWDAADRLKAVNWGAQRVEWTYNGLGQKVLETVNGTAARRFLWDGIELLLEKTPSGTITKRFYGEGEQRVGGTDAGNYFYTRDHLGSVREVLKQDGTLQARYDYDAYGKRTALYQNSAYLKGCDFSFTGHFTLESPASGHHELLLTHYRAYDPLLGRWLSTDPLGEVAGTNLYAYGPNNPINGFDPDGLDWHHLIPFTAGLDAGLSPDFINSAGNGWDLDAANHQKLHYGTNWSNEWKDFFAKCGKKTTQKQAKDQLNRMMSNPDYASILNNGSKATSEYDPAKAKRRLAEYYERRGKGGLAKKLAKMIPKAKGLTTSASVMAVLGASSARGEFMDHANTYIESGDDADKIKAMIVVMEATNTTAGLMIEKALEEAWQDHNSGDCE